MIKDNRDSHLIFFGKKDDSILPSDIKESRFSLMLQNIAQDHGLQSFVILEQVHGAQGVVVAKNFSVIPQALLAATPDAAGLTVPAIAKGDGWDGDPDIKQNLQPISWFSHSGDFLVTNQKNIALMVLTADCSPLVLYDPVSHAIGLIHAGWKGSYAGVLQEALSMMQKKYQTNFKDLICHFGPSARSCCYQVSQQFVDDFDKKYPGIAEFKQRDQKYYFDNVQFLKQLLKKFGIQDQNIYTNSALCTICNLQFCSFRKEKEMAGRQITMVALF